MEITDQTRLFQADCLALFERFPSGCVDLCYVDPPEFGGAQAALAEPAQLPSRDGASDRHLLLLSQVLQQVHRVLAPSGTLFLHTRPPLTYRLRFMLEQFFGEENLRMEIIWPLITNRVRADAFWSHHDTILFYSKASEYVHREVLRPLTSQEIAQRYQHRDKRGRFALEDLTRPGDRGTMEFEWLGVRPQEGRAWKFTRHELDRLLSGGQIYKSPSADLPRLKRYLSKASGMPAGSVWSDIRPLSARTAESAGFPEQKPIALLDRVLQLGSDPGAVVLDPICGSGTTAIAAQRERRRWIACDVAPTAIKVSIERLLNEAQARAGQEYLLGDQDLLTHQYPILFRSYRTIPSRPADFSEMLEPKFFKGQPVPIEETRHYEFKEVSGKSPLDSIKNTADEYVVAFLNSEGGRIYWGIRDTDRFVVGVSLTYSERDELNRVVTEKLAAIKPSLDPTAFRIHCHPVFDGIERVPDLFVVEIVVPRVRTKQVYFTGGDVAFVKTDAGKKKLAGPALVDWLKRRLEEGEP